MHDTKTRVTVRTSSDVNTYIHTYTRTRTRIMSIRRIVSHGRGVVVLVQDSVATTVGLSSEWWLRSSCGTQQHRKKSDFPSYDYHRNDVSDCAKSRSRGLDVLHDPVFNKGTGHRCAYRQCIHALSYGLVGWMDGW